MAVGGEDDCPWGSYKHIEENPGKGAPLLVAIGAFLEIALRGELGLSGDRHAHRRRYIHPLSYRAVYSPIGLV
jgi:hypothetical protein